MAEIYCQLNTQDRHTHFSLLRPYFFFLSFMTLSLQILCDTGRGLYYRLHMRGLASFKEDLAIQLFKWKEEIGGRWGNRMEKHVLEKKFQY